MSLYCKDATTGSTLRVRGSRVRPERYRVVANVRGQEFDPGKPFAMPLAGGVDLGSTGGAFPTYRNVTENCRVTNNGDRTSCSGEGVPPTPTPTPTPTPVPTPTPCVPFSVSNGKGGTYTDNCNGTVTDSTSGLIWEKKTDDGGIHDKDDTYTWTAVNASPWPFTGTAATVFLATLNTVPCFAGFCDWRLPTIDELSGRSDGGIATGGIVDLTVPGCTGGGSPRINAIFGPTRCSYYWSSAETISSGPNVAWSVDFYNGNVVIYGKTYDIFVRAVRSGS